MVTIDWGDYPDWRDRLAAARQPTSRAQDAYDDRWRRGYRRAVRLGKSPNQAAAVADDRTKGPRPANEETT
jgi:hypothetical protein